MNQSGIVRVRLGLVVGVAVLGAQGWSCCGVAGRNRQVTFVEQLNLVVWDPATKTEHFVRRASFASKAADVGFIAPTPTVPKLAEAQAGVFAYIESLNPTPAFGSKGVSGGAGAGGVSRGVTVVHEQDVAGYHATTLKATDAKGLADWMKENGFETTPGIEKWTAVYIKKSWYLTAFKVKMKSGAGTTGTVRMSFKTEKPFNPYFVPKENQGKGQSGLRLYFMAPGHASAKIGGKTDWQDPNWSVEASRHDTDTIASNIGMNDGDLPYGMRITAFYDSSFPNAAKEDLYFKVDRTQESAIPAWFALVFAGLFGTSLMVWRVKVR